MYLQAMGHDIHVAFGGADALARVAAIRPDACLLDVGLPDMNGYETAAALRTITGLETIMLVALTGWGDERDRARAKAAGFDHHLTKPADLDAIEQLLHPLAPAAS